MALTGVSGRLALEPPLAKTTEVRVALIPTGSTSRPVANLLTNTLDVAVTTEGTAEAVTMTMAATATGSDIQEGQPLSFYSATTGRYYFAVVRTRYTDAAAAVLELTTAQTIPADAVAEFPAPFRIRNSADLTETVATTGFSSFDHANSSQSIGDGTANFVINGGYSYYDAGLATCKCAKDLTQKLYAERELEPPDAVFGSGPIDWFIGIVTNIGSPAQDGASVGGDVTIAVSGAINRIDPTT